MHYYILQRYQGDPLDFSYLVWKKGVASYLNITETNRSNSKQVGKHCYKCLGIFFFHDSDICSLLIGIPFSGSSFLFVF